MHRLAPPNEASLLKCPVDPFSAVVAALLSASFWELRPVSISHVISLLVFVMAAQKKPWAHSWKQETDRTLCLRHVLLHRGPLRSRLSYCSNGRCLDCFLGHEPQQFLNKVQAERQQKHPLSSQLPQKWETKMQQMEQALHFPVRLRSTTHCKTSKPKKHCGHACGILCKFE